MEQKTVFLSYRRSISRDLARSIYLELKMNGWDVFLDVNSIDAGDFDKIILNQIAARAHFILLIKKDSLLRCKNAGDWVLKEIEEAVRLQRNIVPIIDEDANFNQEMSYLPSDLRNIISKKNALPLSHFYFDEGMIKLRTRFLKSPDYVQITTPSSAESIEVQRRLEQVEAMVNPSTTTTPSPVGTQYIASAAKPTSQSLMPTPFAWIEIPGRSGMMKTDEESVTLTIPTERYWIAKYPTTNAQFSEFIKAGGYNERKWWTDAGWEFREKEDLTEPRNWKESKWNGITQPIVGVSWYEAIAFCRWLSDKTGEKIMLPTEAQWQYAAQGDDGRAYPWGNQWNRDLCNNNVDSKGIGKTAPVTQYESGGNSPFGVVDMAGNVWEWCLTSYKTGSHDINGTDIRVLRGGSLSSSITVYFRCIYRNGDDPHYWDSNFGFRIARTS